MQDDPVKKEMLNRGMCLHCCAYWGSERSGKKCRSLKPGCPADGKLTGDLHEKGKKRKKEKTD